MEKRQYQIDDVAKINKSLKENSSTVYVLSTGGGKSVVVTMLVDGWVKEKKRVLVLAHRRRLLNQLEGHFSKKNMSIGMMIGKIERDMSADVVIASINTATREKRITTLLEENFDYIVVDEAHRIASDSYAFVLKSLQEKNKETKLLGVTATPTRRDKKRLNNYFNDMVVGIQIEELQQLGYLAKAVTWSRPVTDIDQEVEKNSNDYNRTSLSAYMKHPDRVRMAVESYETHAKGKQMLSFCVDREHAVSVCEAFKAKGHTSIEILDSTLSQEQQEAIIKRYEDGELEIIVSIDILNEGVDLPETGVIQLNRPTMSLTVYMQQVGRGLRKKSDGSDLIILDNAGCSQNFGLVASPKSWSLNPNESPTKPAEKNKVVGKRKDGSYTEDMNEEDLELEEMTPEDYLEKMITSIDKANEFNSKLETEITKEKYALVNKFLDESGLRKAGFKLDESGRVHHGLNRFELLDTMGRNVLDLTIRENSIDLGKTYRYDVDTAKQKAKFYSLLSVFYTFVSNDKTSLAYRSAMVIIEAKKHNKIDVASIKDKQEEMKTKMVIAALNDAITPKANIILLDIPVRFDKVYPTMGYCYDKILGVKFVKGKILQNNHVSLLMGAGNPKEIKTMKLEKVLEILQSGMNSMEKFTLTEKA